MNFVLLQNQRLKNNLQSYMRCFNYTECEKQDELFDYLEDCLNEGYLNFKVNETNDEILIENVSIDEDDEIYTTLIKKYELIEDLDHEDFPDGDYNDFYYDSDNMEDY